MSLIKEARRYAEHAHSGQMRKLSDKPYIIHPINVGNILEKAGFSEEVIAAAYLHDAVEDTSVTLEEIVQRFGLEVAGIVEAHTENKSKSWEERKQHTIQIVKTGSLEVKSLIVADKLDNLRSLKESYDQQGDTIWNSLEDSKSRNGTTNPSANTLQKDWNQAKFQVFFIRTNKK